MQPWLKARNFKNKEELERSALRLWQIDGREI